MATLPETQAELEALRAKVAAESRAARDAGDTAKREQLRALLGEIDDELDRLALADLQAAANRIVGYRTRLEALTRAVLAWPFGTAEAPVNHERPFRAKDLPPNDFADAGPAAPPPPVAEPLPPAIVPQVSPDWSENYRQLWNTLAFSSADWQKQATAVAQKIVANQARYAAAVAGMQVPWWFVAVLHCMECSMRFDQHLHNGDPLSGRTVQVPPGRPTAGAPPFTWEVSAHDAIQFERLDRVTDWSLPSVLFNWHRYNGINNEYKRRGIPTPYLWSGSTHYKKGKYVADGVFDPEFVSRQLGAAVILKALVDLGAVTVEQPVAPAANPAVTAAADTPAPPAANPAVAPVAAPPAPPPPVGPVAVEASAAALPHIAQELAYPGLLKQGAGGIGVKRVQEWLRIHGFPAPLDSDFGSETADQLKAFQASQGRPPSGELDEQTWELLTAPMRKALVKIENAAGMSLDELAITIAKQHLAQKPIEIGGNNRGPWVRLYMAGRDGEDQLWCAGFVCFVVDQACRELKIAMPFKRQVFVPTLVNEARATGRLVNPAELNTPQDRRSKLKPGYIFVVRDGASFSHTGFVLSVNDARFDTVEGNTSADGGNDGANAKQGSRPFAGNDFIRLT